MLLAKLTHINLDQRFLTPKHLTSQYPCKFRFADTCWSHKYKAADRTLLTRHTTATSSNRSRYFRHGIFLTDNIPAQVRFELLKKSCFTRLYFLDRDIGHDRDGMGNILLGENNRILCFLRFADRF